MKTEIKERPMLFSAPMVRAILDGSKTQTRRVVKSAKDRSFGVNLAPCEIAGEVNRGSRFDLCPYGQPGDQLWVREAFSVPEFSPYYNPPEWDSNNWLYAHCKVKYSADGEVRSVPELTVDENDIDQEAQAERCSKKKSVPSIHMPRWASRINLEITAVRVERLNDISESDAKAEASPGYDEGIDAPPPNDGEYTWSYVASFQKLWESISGAGSWQQNPWVWVIEFKVMKP